MKCPVCKGEMQLNYNQVIHKWFIDGYESEGIEEVIYEDKMYSCVNCEVYKEEK